MTKLMKSHRNYNQRASQLHRFVSTFLLLLVPALVISSAANAQETRTLVCGVRIVSEQPYPGGLCLFVHDTNDHTRVQMKQCSDTFMDPGFAWNIVRHDGGGVHIVSALNPERRMDVAGGSLDDHAPIQMWGANIPGWDANQTWDFVPATNGGFQIESVGSKKCLNVPLYGGFPGFPIEGDYLQQYDCEGHPNDTWTIQQVMPDICH